MKKYEIMEWSLNLSSSLKSQIPDWVLDSMKIKDNGKSGKTFPDITFLNEVVFDNDSCKKLIRDFENEGFRVICSNNNHGNQVAIAISKEFKINKIIHKIPYACQHLTPDFLHVEIEDNGIIYNLVPVRIRIDSNNSDDPESYKHRKIQFEIYKNYISDLTNVISAVDFNHARILGDEDDISEKSQSIYSREQVAQRFFNYQMIKYAIESPVVNKRILTPKSNSLYTSANGKEKKDNLSSVGIKLYKNVFQYPCIDKDKQNNFKIDHFIVSKSIDISDPYYDWNFLQNFLCQENSVPRDYFCESENGKVKTGYPDHAQLRASIAIE